MNPEKLAWVLYVLIKEDVMENQNPDSCNQTDFVAIISEVMPALNFVF
jgi:hypothetical protein